MQLFLIWLYTLLGYDTCLIEDINYSHETSTDMREERP